MSENSKSNDKIANHTAGRKRDGSTTTKPSNDDTRTKSLPVLLNGHFGNPKYSTSPTSSPPNKKTFDDPVALNMRLAHEIALNDDCSKASLNKQVEEDSTLTAVKVQMLRAYWNCLADDLKSDPPIYDRAFVTISDLKNMLVDLLPHNRVTSVHKTIAKLLDIDFLKQQAQHGALDVKKLSESIIDVMASMCAPARDENIDDLRKIEDTAELLKEIFSVLHLMKQDQVNFMIDSIRPIVQDHQVQYEREKFQTLLKTMPNGPVATKNWFQTAYNKVKTENSASGTSTDPGPFVVLERAFLLLIEEEYRNGNFPETVKLDKERFVKLRQEFNRLVLVASMILTTITSLSSQLSSHSSYIHSLKKTLMVITENVKDEDIQEQGPVYAEQIWKETNEYIESNKLVFLQILPEKKQLLTEQISSVCQRRDGPIRKILSTRAKKYITMVAALIFQGSQSTKDALEDAAVPKAMQVMENELVEFAITYSKLVILNQKTYGPFYVTLLTDVCKLGDLSNSK